jgi:hypothetical protein
MPKGLGLIVLLLLSVLAVGLVATPVRGSDGLAALQAVVVLVAISGLGAIAFLVGRSHARSIRARRDNPPPAR